MDNVIYQKTRHGLAELNNRTLSLSLRVRRLLIMIDGIKTLEDLAQLAIVDNLPEALEQLEKAHLIEKQVSAVSQIVTNRA